MTFTAQEILLNEARNVRLTAILQKLGGEFGAIQKRPAVVILPGGGYSMCSDREAEVVAYPYMEVGYHAFVLRYSVGEHKTWPNPLADFEQTMELLEEKAEEWHILTEKIAVIGFSAGGHLAACAATMAKHRPSAAILGYPAVAKEVAEACQPGNDIPSPTDYVDGNTIPCFLFAARDDVLVPISGLLDFERKLFDYGIQFESHIYAYGGHGFGPGTACVFGSTLCTRVPKWVKDSIGWLADLFGRVDIAGMGKPACSARVNGNWESVLSVDCTLGYLRALEAAQAVVGGTIATLDNIISKRFDGSTGAAAVLDLMKLGELMATVGTPAETIRQLDEALRLIPNKRQCL